MQEVRSKRKRNANDSARRQEMTDRTKYTGLRMAWHVSIFMGTIFGIWSIAAFLSGLAQVNWQINELFRQYLIAIGVMQEFHTMVDFYTYIKGVEYIFCLLFLSIFPAYYIYLNKKQDIPVAERGALSVKRQ
jgi:hypothetical protein